MGPHTVLSARASGAVTSSDTLKLRPLAKSQARKATQLGRTSLPQTPLEGGLLDVSLFVWLFLSLNLTPL